MIRPPEKLDPTSVALFLPAVLPAVYGIKTLADGTSLRWPVAVFAAVAQRYRR